MIDLEKPITLTEAVINSPNLCDRFNERDLEKIGHAVVEGYKIDKDSRSKWEKRNELALNLALQLAEEKTFPWPGASNVKFPLVTIAAIQWHSRAYPMLIQGPDIVKMNINGPDPDGQLRQSADRVASYMSYQLLEESPDWEEEADRSLLQVPIVGCAFKKTYHSALEGRNISELVSARDFVINYYAKSVSTAQRKTHVIPMYRNDIYEKCTSGVWHDVTETQWFNGQPKASQTNSVTNQDKRTGLSAPATSDFTTPFQILEQHVRMDLDGDGYAEPYIVTVEETSGEVCRVVANFEPDDVLRVGGPSSRIVRVKETQWFTKIPFIPSPDGAIYDIGFGVLLGPTNHAVDSILNQLIDAGTLATTSGGFLGRGVKIRGGEYSFRPFGWQRVDSTGEDLAKGVFPFPVREPSSTLFNLLSLLIDYTNRISGSTDIMVGENPGQNTPAQTSQLMAEQGAKINSAIFKRVWRAFKEEFQKMYLLNRKHTPVTVLQYGSESGWVRRNDFQLNEAAIRPGADPHLSSDGHRAQQAIMVKQFAASTPGYNKDAVERMVLRAMRVESIDTLFPGSDKVQQPPHPKVMLENLKGEHKMKLQEADHKARLLQMMVEMEAASQREMAEVELIRAQIAEIVSQIGSAQAAGQVKAFEAQIGALKAMDESRRGYMELLMKGMENGSGDKQGAVPRMAAPPGNAGGPQAPAGPAAGSPAGMV
jgi:chaperonin GroES